MQRTKPPVRERLLTILSSDTWLARVEIAFALGRPNPWLARHDLDTLELLVTDGKVEKRAVDYHGIQKRWEYRKARQ